MVVLATLAQDGARRPIILLVEDHADTRAMYAEFLSAAFEVRQAPDGVAALRSMGERRPDLIVTDLSLPGLDGFELVSRVRADDALRHIPIICLSGYGGHLYEERARNAGCDRLVQKPCLPDKLLTMADELLRNRREVD